MRELFLFGNNNKLYRKNTDKHIELLERNYLLNLLRN